MTKPPHCLLIIEDSDEDFEALSRIIDQMYIPSLTIHRCINGDDASDFLNQAGNYCDDNALMSKYPHRSQPDLILLDLNLPGTDGREILFMIKQSKLFRSIPVVVLSTSSNPKDIEDCYQYGANSYMLKPIDFNHLKDLIRTTLDYWLRTVTLPTLYRP